MPEYVVDIGHEEENEDYLSITGTVDGRQCAAVVNKRTLALVPEKERQNFIDRAMISAFLGRVEAQKPKVGRKVTVE